MSKATEIVTPQTALQSLIVPPVKKHSYLTLAFMQIAAGGSAGFVEVCIMHPLDLIKTRFQIQRGADDMTRYKSMSDCVKTMYRTEGALSFYKGILPPILAETPKRATKFFSFEQYKELFKFGSDTSTFTSLTLAGLAAGLTEAVVVNPFEVVKVSLQADRSKTRQISTIARAKLIIAENGYGLKGLNKGLTSTLARNGAFNMIYFSFYHNLKEFIPKSTEGTNTHLMWRIWIGFCAGTLASVANIPFDVAKSRIQGPQPQPGVIKYRTCLATMKTVYKEEGFFALYKGLLPKVMRLGPDLASVFSCRDEKTDVKADEMIAGSQFRSKSIFAFNQQSPEERSC